MESDNTTPTGPQPGSMPNQTDPYRPNNYDWQRGLAQQAADPRIIPLPDPTKEQAMQPAPPQPEFPEAPPLSSALPHMPEPEPYFAPPPQPLQPAVSAPITEPEPAPQPAIPAPATALPRQPKAWRTILIIVLIAALLGGAVYVFFIRSPQKDDANPPSTSTSKPEKKPAKDPIATPAPAKAIDLASLTMVRFTAPGDMSSYDLLVSGETFWRYTSKAKGTCELGFGVLSAADLPGLDLHAIIHAQIAALRDSGATVVGPTNGSALEISDSASAPKTYSLPTVHFEIAKDNVRAKSHYSAVVLKNGKRAVVNRTCYTTDDSGVADSDMDALDATARKLTVTPQ